MAIRDPQAWADRQGKRSNMKKESKKRKVKSFADGKVRERPTKRRT
jgi:U3 small nucleolar RNA-associated protein 20